MLPYAGSHRVPAHDPVLLVPGFMAGDSTLKAMAVFLRHQGFRTYRSQIRVNAGCTREAADRLESAEGRERVGRTDLGVGPAVE